MPSSVNGVYMLYIAVAVKIVISEEFLVEIGTIRGLDFPLPVISTLTSRLITVGECLLNIQKWYVPAHVSSRLLWNRLA